VIDPSVTTEDGVPGRSREAPAAASFPRPARARSVFGEALLDGPAVAPQGGRSLMRPRIRREPALKEAWERISTLEGPERASRTPVVGAIRPPPGNEMVMPEELPVEPSAGQGLLNPCSQDEDGSADSPDGEGDRNGGRAGPRVTPSRVRTWLGVGATLTLAPDTIKPSEAWWPALSAATGSPHHGVPAPLDPDAPDDVGEGGFPLPPSQTTLRRRPRGVLKQGPPWKPILSGQAGALCCLLYGDSLP
jgi:hypothetical protein